MIDGGRKEEGRTEQRKMEGRKEGRKRRGDTDDDGDDDHANLGDFDDGR